MSIAESAINLANIEVISFDLDDTLWDCAPAIKNAERALLEWHRQKTPRITDELDEKALQMFRNRFRETRPELKGCVTAMRIAGLEQLLSEYGYEKSLAEEAFTVFYDARSEVELYDGAVEMLATLKKTHRLAAITNGNANLQSIGIAQYFDEIYAANLTLLEKPAPDMFLRCISDLEITPSTLLHVGDNPVTDVHGAMTVGVQTVWFNQYNVAWPDHLDPPHYEVNKITEVTALVHP